MLSAGDLAERLDGRLSGDPRRKVAGLATNGLAGEGDATVLVGAGLYHRMMTSRAGLLVAPLGAPACDRDTLRVSDPIAALVGMASYLPLKRTRQHERSKREPRIHPCAKVAPSAEVGPGVVIGASSEIGSGALIKPDVRIGDFCSIGDKVVIESGVSIGNRVSLSAGTLIGESGFAFHLQNGRWTRIPSMGTVVIEDDAELGAACVVARGVLSDTRIGRGAKIDGQVFIGHDVTIGSDTIIAAQTAIAGAAFIGERCKLGGRCAISEGVRLTDEVELSGASNVTRSLDNAGRYASVWPVASRSSWWRMVAAVRRLSGAEKIGSLGR
ncbi:MAG: UDP-3-O-(3-hydroxymyristoyl)glucosamine N-acyltransferase [Pseudomonadota bacterium]